MGHAPAPKSCLIVHHGDDRAWVDWVAAQLADVGLPCDTFALDWRDPPSERYSQIVVLESNVALRTVNHGRGSERRFFWAGLGRNAGMVVLRIANTSGIRVINGGTAYYEWDADLVGRTEDDARRELLTAIARKFGHDPRSDADRRHRAQRAPFPGLTTVFISYRRADNEDGIVSRFHAAMEARLPRARIFFDVADPDPRHERGAAP